MLILKPQYIHHHSPFVSLNKQLCEHLGSILPIDKLGVRQSLSKDFNEKIRQMPVLGTAKVFEIVESEAMTKLLFDGSVFTQSTMKIRVQNAKLRQQNQITEYALMVVQPQHIRDAMKIPDVFRIDPVRQSNRKIQELFYIVIIYEKR